MPGLRILTRYVPGAGEGVGARPLLAAPLLGLADDPAFHQHVGVRRRDAEGDREAGADRLVGLRQGTFRTQAQAPPRSAGAGAAGSGRRGGEPAPPDGAARTTGSLGAGVTSGRLPGVGSGTGARGRPLGRRRRWGRHQIGRIGPIGPIRLIPWSGDRSLRLGAGLGRGRFSHVDRRLRLGPRQDVPGPRDDRHQAEDSHDRHPDQRPPWSGRPPQR